MKPTTPAGISNQDVLNKSINLVLTGNTSPGNGDGTEDASGQPLAFTLDNMCGCILRVGSNVNPYTLPNFWSGSNLDTVITHNLNKIPYGYIVIAKSGNCDVYWGSVVADLTTITLKNTDGTQDTTIWFLA